MTRDTCRRSTCDNEPRDDAQDAYARKFCSAECEVKHDHIKADAEDARRAEETHHDEQPRHDRGGRYV